MIRLFSRRSDDRGQILVIVGVGMVAFLGFAALVTDIGMLWSAQQQQRVLADSAALAGGQELQRPGSRAVDPQEREEARGRAMANIIDQLMPGGALPTCSTGGVPTADTDGDGKAGYAADVIDCAIPGTDFSASLVTPSPLCVTCDEERSIMVEVTRNNVPTFFAAMFGFDGWTTRQTSVAGLDFEAQFAIITLRPPRYLGPTNDANASDVGVDGAGTALTVTNGDIGTNTNIVLSGSGASVNLDSGYKAHYYDTYRAWSGAPASKDHCSVAEPCTSAQYIQDPNYPYPSRVGATTYANEAAASMTDAECQAQLDLVPDPYVWGTTRINDMPVADVACLKPGVYNFRPRAAETANATQNSVLLFTPGVYFLDRGLFNHGAVLGGYVAGQPGVALVFRECNSNACDLDANNAEVFALNGGTRYKNAGGVQATAAIAADGNRVETGGDPNIMITILVQRDARCVVTQPYPTLCGDTQNRTLHMSGGGALYLAGVQYAPSDNIDIGGSSAGVGYAGQIIAWTVSYRGDSQVQQEYPGSSGNAIMRLDAACSGGGSSSMSNAACNP